jgi:hypothetical protein
MSVDGRRSSSLRVSAVAAPLLLWAGPLLAQPVEVPRVEVPVGSGAMGTGAAVGASVMAAPLLAPTAFAPVAAPSVAPAAVLAAPAASLAAAPLAKAAVPVAAVPVAAPALAAASPAASIRADGSFGKRIQAPAPPTAASDDPAANDADWSRSAQLFDLSAAPGADAQVAVPAGLPANKTGQAMARLRKIGATGPGAIPGMDHAEWAGFTGGRSGETSKLLIGGKPWYLKRFDSSPDPVIAAMPREDRARNEVGFAAMLRSDPLLSASFAVSPQVRVFRDGREIFVLTEGLPTVGDGESRRQELSPLQRADAAIIQLALGMGDMHGGDVLPLGGGRYGLIDFEKLSRAPLKKAALSQVDEEVLLKNFPLVDRLSFNDPALYLSRFRSWRKEYESGGRSRMDAALAASGWTPEQRQTYLTAVDRNLDTYLERLWPYLEYANAAYQRVVAARAEAARAPPEPKGFLSGLFGSGR